MFIATLFTGSQKAVAPHTSTLAWKIPTFPLAVCKGSSFSLSSSTLVFAFFLIAILMVVNQIPYDYTVEVRNRFKGLDLIDRVPDELWMEVHDIVQETGIKTIPMEKKCKKAKWLSEEALQIAVKR